MGIYNFHAWLRNKFPEIYINIKNNNIYDYIYIDINFLLHNAIYDCKTETEFLKKIYMNLNIIFSNFIATKKIILALDGPSSYAKIVLQRKRRINASTKINKNVINSLCITPGIEFMQNLETNLKIYLNKTTKQYKYLHPEFELLSSNDPDEGEIKICKKLIEYGSNNLAYRHLIIGNDSDLIVLSMGMKPIYNINILVKGKDENQLISLEKLLISHASLLGRSCIMNELSMSNIRDDYVIISIMMGNDYIPKLGYTNPEMLWKIYYNIMKNRDETLIENNIFNKQMFALILFNIYNKLSNGFKKINSKLYNHTRAQSYLKGLLWCLNMYKTGICSMYDYLYEGHISPHPYELLFCILAEYDDIAIPYSETNPIKSSMYPLIVMPMRADYLLKKEYQDLMKNELKYLYDAETCIQCDDFRKNLNILLKEKIKMKNNGTSNKEEKELSQQYKNKLYEYKTHKKKHYNTFNHDDINKIIKYVTEL